MEEFYAKRIEYTEQHFASKERLLRINVEDKHDLFEVMEELYGERIEYAEQHFASKESLLHINGEDKRASCFSFLSCLGIGIKSKLLARSPENKIQAREFNGFGNAWGGAVI
ncbi:MAG: hypothetical protein ACO26G_06870, partial [Rickettsiales bacterium]